MRPEIRPARPEDLREYFGGRVPVEHWFGYAAEREGVLVGIGGIAWLEQGAFIFMECAQNYMPAPMTAHRMALALIEAAHKAGEDVIYGAPAANVPTAKRWFRALGFKPDRVMNGIEVWACRAG